MVTKAKNEGKIYYLCSHFPADTPPLLSLPLDIMESEKKVYLLTQLLGSSMYYVIKFWDFSDFKDSFYLTMRTK